MSVFLGHGRACPGLSVVARAGTPRTTVATVNRVLTDCMARADVQEKLLAIGIRSRTSTPDELATYIVSEGEKWVRVVRDAGITPE